jgi:N-methylhydantoinase A
VKAQIAKLGEICDDSAPPAAASMRAAYFGSSAGWLDCPVYDRRGLSAGTKITGPALIADSNATTVVYPGHDLTVDAYGNLLIAVPE